jgi:hypothetical protein
LLNQTVLLAGVGEKFVPVMVMVLESGEKTGSPESES